MERVPTGISGFDELIGGGFPRGRSMLISGGTGTGKTIFCIQFLLNGATQYNEPGVYVTLDERPGLIREDMLQFGWDLRKLEDEGKLIIVDASMAKIGIPSSEEYSISSSGFDLDKLIVEIMRVSKEIGARRLAIDSLAAMGLHFSDQTSVRKAILKLNFMMMRTNLTTLATSEIPEGSNLFSKYGVEEFVADGVIMLHYLGIGTQSNRTLHIRKMRGTPHSEDIHPLEITKKGIKVHKVDEAYGI
ncbi:MAG: circadian clock protein KaiC [Candidatus Diapherotrites archaeon]|nr:circadian clock protein KaiC [Candidatus Diapherotrites archaeon]